MDRCTADLLAGVHKGGADEELGSLGSLVRGRVVEVGVAGAVTARHLRPLVAVAVPERAKKKARLSERVSGADASRNTFNTCNLTPTDLPLLATPASRQQLVILPKHT